MATQTTTLPISETLTAESEQHVADVLQSANESRTPVYTIGGGTSLGLGLPATLPGWGLSTTGLNRIVDYPVRDMTITVGAGITIKELQQTLGAESQRLAIDCPHADVATLGGLIATNHSGPSRYGHGTLRDHVIGIRAVEGLGNAFAAGGRVVKNVAGYDFCKLLTGSLGTLGVITEVTLKLKPVPPAKAFVVCQPTDLEQAETLLAELVNSSTTPVIVELLSGTSWQELTEHESETSSLRLVVGFEGTDVEVDWMVQQIETEWRQQDVAANVVRDAAKYASLHQQLTDFPADDSAAMIVKLTGVPSGVTRAIETLRLTDETVNVQAHAGNGVVIGKFAEYPGNLTPFKAVAATSMGSATILSNPGGAEMTRHNVWGCTDVPFDVMQRVKDAFDPHNLLNPGRFVY